MSQSLEIRPQTTKKIGFFVPPGVSMLGLDCASDTLRLANRWLGREAYQWITIGKTNDAIRATNGLMIAPDFEVSDRIELDMLFVCGGLEAATFADRKVLNWLRGMARKVEIVGGITTGAFILARAGLLNGYSCTTHWEDAETFRELYPEIALSDGIFVIDRNRMTSAGGLVTIDLFLQIVARDQGAEPTLAMASAYQLDRVRNEADRQSWSILRRHRSPPDLILQATRIMEQNIEHPKPIAEIAALLGTTPRQIHRMFTLHLLETPSHFYRELRLREARRLIRTSPLALSQVALATGFSSHAAFSRSYRASFGHSPSEESPFGTAQHPAE